MIDKEITPDRLSFLEAAEGLASDPEIRGQFFDLMKKKNPSLSIPEVDVRRQMETMLAQEREAREKLEQRLKDKETTDKIREARALALSKSGLTEADIPDIEKAMTEKGIVNHETAAEYVKQSRQIAAGASPSPGPKAPVLPNPVDEAKEKYGGNMKDWAKSTALSILQDMRKAA